LQNALDHVDEIKARPAKTGTKKKESMPFNWVARVKRSIKPRVVCVLQNMLDHADEIKARPAKTWFQTERQKKELAAKMEKAAAGEPVDDDEVRR
jgi:hypothetical protein